MSRNIALLVLMLAVAPAWADEAGTAAQPDPQPAKPPPAGSSNIPIQLAAEWDPALVTLPEPALFMTARRLELLAGVADTGAIRQELKQWRILAHDGKRKVGANWLSREQVE